VKNANDETHANNVTRVEVVSDAVDPDEGDNTAGVVLRVSEPAGAGGGLPVTGGGVAGWLPYAVLALLVSGGASLLLSRRNRTHS